MASKAAREKTGSWLKSTRIAGKSLNDVINSCVKEKPADPFASMAQMLKEHSSSAAGIITVAGSEVLDGRGRPTLQVTIETNRGFFSAMSPSGSAPLGGEGGARAAAVHLLDGQDDRFSGEGVLKAVKLVNEQIAPMLVGMNPTDQSAIDRALIDFDGTSSLSKLGANTLLAISYCCARAGAAEKEVPLFQHIADLAGCRPFLSQFSPRFRVAGCNRLNYQEIRVPNRCRDVTEGAHGRRDVRALREAVEEDLGGKLH